MRSFQDMEGKPSELVKRDEREREREREREGERERAAINLCLSTAGIYAPS